jgi:hypothetical protein
MLLTCWPWLLKYRSTLLTRCCWDTTAVMCWPLARLPDAACCGHAQH